MELQLCLQFSSVWVLFFFPPRNFNKLFFFCCCFLGFFFFGVLSGCCNFHTMLQKFVSYRKLFLTVAVFKDIPPGILNLQGQS